MVSALFWELGTHLWLTLKKPKENQCFFLIVALGILLAILGTILVQNGLLGGPLNDLGHNLERHSLYSQTPDPPQSGHYVIFLIGKVLFQSR